MFSWKFTLGDEGEDICNVDYFGGGSFDIFGMMVDVKWVGEDWSLRSLRSLRSVEYVPSSMSFHYLQPHQDMLNLQCS